MIPPRNMTDLELATQIHSWCVAGKFVPTENTLVEIISRLERKAKLEEHVRRLEDLCDTHSVDYS